MNIKSLLLGSSAAIVAVSSSQAADAVVVEPEPVEYVRVCDAYGSGFFYIPGTETCIRFSGYVRSSYEKTTVDRTVVSSAGGVTDPTLATGFNDEIGFNFWGQRARLNIDTRNETDWGTLRAIYRLEGGDSNVDANIDMDVALISLAGFRAGFAGANYWSTNHGFAGVNFTGLGSGFTAATDEGWYGFDDATIFDYTWAGDGFSVTIGVEDPRISVGGTSTFGNVAFGNATNNGGSDSRANFYAGFNYSQDWGTFAFTAVHDSTAVDTEGFGILLPISDVGGWAYKASLTLDLSDFVPGGILHGMYMTDGDYRTSYVHNWNGQNDPESIWQIAFQADLSDEVQLVAQYSHSDASGISPGPVAEGDAWNASVGLNWFPAAAPGFSLRASYKFGEFENAYRSSTGGFVDSIVDEEFDSFFVGVRRDF